MKIGRPAEGGEEPEQEPVPGGPATEVGLCAGAKRDGRGQRRASWYGLSVEGEERLFWLSVGEESDG